MELYRKNEGNLVLNGYTDADYAGCIDTRKSTSGFVFMCGGSVTWSSQRKNVVSLFTTEAEYIAFAHGTKKAIWLFRMLRELNFECTHVPIFVDNQSTIKLSNNPEFHKRTKHIDDRFHFIRDVVDRKIIIDINYISTKEQLADMFTKPLSKQRFLYIRDNLSIVQDTK